MTTSRRLADRKVNRFDKNISRRGAVPETSTKKGTDYPVGPLLLGFFIFVVIGSCCFVIDLKIMMPYCTSSIQTISLLLQKSRIMSLLYSRLSGQPQTEAWPKLFGDGCRGWLFSSHFYVVLFRACFHISIEAASENWLWFDISGGLASVIRLKASAIVARTGHAAKLEFWVALTESLKGRRGWPTFGKVKVREPTWSHIGNSHQRLNFDVTNIKEVDSG
ncbi:hypothetical protein DKX38_004892 [Salix brachista]|uniref:Uncharacterized protein n=1 Tax=Salix brachista TaxID=2182728 RepID=A0A5N5NCR5_9ROSI|nr:hypothetical protein DKX38_004892 [Salix brachista]